MFLWHSKHTHMCDTTELTQNVHITNYNEVNNHCDSYCCCFCCCKTDGCCLDYCKRWNKTVSSVKNWLFIQYLCCCSCWHEYVVSVDVCWPWTHTCVWSDLLVRCNWRNYLLFCFDSGKRIVLPLSNAHTFLLTAVFINRGSKLFDKGRWELHFKRAMALWISMYITHCHVCSDQSVYLAARL